VHAGGVLRLDADHVHAGVQILHVHHHAGQQTAAADRHEDGVERAAGLAQDLDRDAVLAGDDIGVVEGVHEHQVALARELQRALVRTVVIIAVQHHLRTEIDHGLHLDGLGGLRHDHDRGDAARPRGERYP